MRYVVDCILSLYQVRIVEADSPEEAQRKADELLDDDEVWNDLVGDWGDSMITDWIRENAEASVYGPAGEGWDDCKVIGG